MDGHFKQPPDFSYEDNRGMEKNLKLIAKNCEFKHLKDELIRDRTVCGTNSSRVKERLLREEGLTLDKAVGICRADEESRKQIKTLNEEEQVHALRRKIQNQRTNRNEGYAKKGPSRRDHEKRESNSNPDDPVKSFPKVFTGLGCLEKPYHIKIDSSVNPVINPPRMIPAALRENLKGKLKEMEDKEVIRKVDEPTDWVNALVVVEKPKTGKLRICLVPRNLNKAIKREHFALLTIEDITTRLTGAKYLSKLDCNDGYWQLRMDKDSQLLTTFNSPFGRCQEVGLTLNAEKCKFGVKVVTYIRHTLNADGVRPDQRKIRAIEEMPAPTDKKGVQQLQGTINYLAKFVPKMSAQQAFEKLKDIITKNPVLSFYDVPKPVTVSCDASQYGLGAMLIQDNKPVAYAPRSLTDAESRYANIERELLGVLFGLERFNDYTYGKHINVESDHKPLEMIVRKSLGCAPPRLQRMLLRLQNTISH
ncbi:unnamed protein product [Mytilus coruscus]|uniref:Reverse transcriptase/retrotransposon-derived protein RNase H-like domain-containing protein n=1 Tax=Mytilus coruscus TaxID=42192 RepID=A0A6J8A948_MYTCO|nr:unnamed protein product [Mytilus coruscus]